MKTVKTLLCLLAAGLLMNLFGCSQKYKIIVSDKNEWDGIKSSYMEGERVIIYYQVIATDSNLNIVVDGESVPVTFDSDKGFRVEFTMPGHDVEVRGVWHADPNGA